jgi:hypothetical protein
MNPRRPELPRPTSRYEGEDWAYALARDLQDATRNAIAKKLRQISDVVRGLDVTCDGCGQPLKEPGGLAFSPPHCSRCTKKHLCKHCWDAFAEWLRSRRYETEHPNERWMDP